MGRNVWMGSEERGDMGRGRRERRQRLCVVIESMHHFYRGVSGHSKKRDPWDHDDFRRPGDSLTSQRRRVSTDVGREGRRDADIPRKRARVRARARWKRESGCVPSAPGNPVTAHRTTPATTTTFAQAVDGEAPPAPLALLLAIKRQGDTSVPPVIVGVVM